MNCTYKTKTRHKQINLKKTHLSAKIFFLAVFMESVKVLRPDIFDAFLVLFDQGFSCIAYS